MTTQGGGFVIRGKHVLMAMLGMFAVVILVNLTFVYFALDSWTGLTTDNAYQEGLAYNQVLAARDAQRDLGWQGDITLGAAEGGQDSITLALKDKAGEPLSGLELTGNLRRPTREGIDQSLVWREEAPGAYNALVALPQRGNWDLIVNASDGRNPPFEMKARLWFK